MFAVEEARFEHIHFHKTADAVQKRIAQAGAFALGGALLGPDIAVEILLGEKLRHVGISVVQRIACQLFHAGVGRQQHFFVHQIIAVAGKGGGIKAHHPIGIPTAMADKRTKSVA